MTRISVTMTRDYATCAICAISSVSAILFSTIAHFYSASNGMCGRAREWMIDGDSSGRDDRDPAAASAA